MRLECLDTLKFSISSRTTTMVHQVAVRDLFASQCTEDMSQNSGEVLRRVPVVQTMLLIPFPVTSNSSSSTQKEWTVHLFPFENTCLIIPSTRYVEMAPTCSFYKFLSGDTVLPKSTLTFLSHF